MFKNTDQWSGIYDSYNRISVSITIMFIGICLSSLTMLVDKNFTIMDACFIFTTVVLIALGLESILFIRYFPVYEYHQSLKLAGETVPYINAYDNCESFLFLLYMALGACLNDAFAYFVGVFFGKHKMNPRVSPKKTWEGFFGGVILTSLVLTGWALLQDGLSQGNHAILKGILDLKHFYHVIILSVLIPLVSVLGDLVFSSIKRFYGIKDFSNVMPGHGGILDRCDSILFAVTTVAIYVCIFANQGAGGIHLP
jgi:phosphatidate cytidylyltransferase